MSRSRLAGLAITAIAAPTVHADIVFNNFHTSTLVSAFEYDLDVGAETDSTIEAPGGAEQISRCGDVVTLAGSARTINLFELRLSGGSVLSGHNPGAAEIVLEIYTVAAGLPDALLWSGEKTIPALPQDLRAADVAFTPDITVPDTIAWAIRFKNVRDTDRQSTFGLVLDRTGALLVGSSPTTYLVQDSATGAWTTTASTTFVDGSARISAVPAPATLALAPAVFLAARRRRG